MTKLTTSVVLWMVGTVMMAAVICSNWEAGGAAQAAPPADQTYVGTKKCASCHFEEYMTWKKSKHAKSFENLPDAYKADAKCLQCHATGFGESTGFKDAASTPDLAGNTCENCHGPGSEHCRIAEQFATKDTLAPNEEKAVKESVWLYPPDNRCAKCHVGVVHNAHEQFEK